MNLKLISGLQKVFWIIDWSVLALAVGTLTIEAYEYFNPTSDSLIQWPKKEFYFLKPAQLLFSAIGQAYFAFLVIAVFDMIFHRAPVRSQQTERFLILTCIGFIGEGFVGIIGWAQAMTGGSLVISTGMGRGNKYLDEVPWLRKMAEEKKASQESSSLFSTISFIALGLLLIGGSIFFAFFRRPTSV